MLDPDVLAIADRWWAGDFACAPGDLRSATPRVQTHAGRMAGAEGIWILVVGSAAPCVSLPAAAMVPLARRARHWTRAVVADASALAAAVRPLRMEMVVGPAWIGYGTSSTLDLSPSAGARKVTPADDDALARLRAACTEEAWAHGGSDHHRVPAFVTVDEQGAILALAGYRTWGEEIAHLSIVSAPGHRGQGHGTAAAAYAARHALGAGLVAQYRTLYANEPSMGVARRLGFESYGFTVFGRLTKDGRCPPRPDDPRGLLAYGCGPA